MSWTRTSPGFPRFATPTSTCWAATASAVLVRSAGRCGLCVIRPTPQTKKTVRPGRAGEPWLDWAGFLAYFDSTRPMGSESAASASRAVCQAGSSGWNALRR